MKSSEKSFPVSSQSLSVAGKPIDPSLVSARLNTKKAGLSRLRTNGPRNFVFWARVWLR